MSFHFLPGSFVSVKNSLISFTVVPFEVIDYFFLWLLLWHPLWLCLLAVYFNIHMLYFLSVLEFIKLFESVMWCLLKLWCITSHYVFNDYFWLSLSCSSWVSDYLHVRPFPWTTCGFHAPDFIFHFLFLSFSTLSVYLLSNLQMTSSSASSLLLNTSVQSSFDIFFQC